MNAVTHGAGGATATPPRIAVVTGAAKGIGAAVVQGLAAAGFVVVATDLGGPPPQDGPGVSKVLWRTMNVTDRAAIERVAAEVDDRFGHLDVLVNNAGVYAQTPALRLDDETMLRILDVNLCGTLRCTAAFGSVMSRHGGGRIINMASVSGQNGAALASIYAASKGGMIAATRSMARELAPCGIVVNAVAPGLCDTEMMAPQRALVERFIVPHIPQKRVATVADVTATVIFLATTASTYMTGSVITMDGGLTSG